MGGCDAEGNPITVSFGSGPAEGETLLGDGDRSGMDKDETHHTFHESKNHDHFGSGNGPHGNGTSRNQYTGYEEFFRRRPRSNPYQE